MVSLICLHITCRARNSGTNTLRVAKFLLLSILGFFLASFQRTSINHGI